MRTRLGRDLTLEEAYRRRCRVEIRFDSDEWGWPSSAGLLNPVRGYIGKSLGPVKIFLLIRQRNSWGGLQIDADHIASIKEVNQP